MLAESADDKPTLLSTSGILKQIVHNPLLHFDTPLSLTTGNFDQRLVHAFDGQRSRLAKGEALLFLGLKCHITGVTVFIVQGL